MRMQSVIWILLCLNLALCTSPIRFFNRKRRQQSDFELMKEYWIEQLPLGFFVNQGASETGDNPAPPGFSLRDKISANKQEGSGGGVETRRDDVPRPTEGAMIVHEKKKLLEENDKIEQDDAGKLAAKVEVSEEPKVEQVKSEDEDLKKKLLVEEEENSGPGDQRKLRHSIACQGEKEWLQCDSPYELIKIKSVFWGRDNDFTCTKKGTIHGLRTDKNCAQDEANTMKKVRVACDNENVCEVVASETFFDTADCSDVYKYINIDWECAKSESRIKDFIR